MSDTPRGPRVILEDGLGPAPRLDLGWEQAVTPVTARPSRRWSGPGLAALGLVVLVLGLALLEVGNFIAEQFARGGALGWLTLAVAALGFGLVLTGLAREARGLFALASVDRARAAFQREDLETARREALAWAARVPEAEGVRPALARAGDVAELRALLEAGPLATLDARAVSVGRIAAMQAFAATALTPSPALDAVVFGWRGLRLVREVAALHGLRPGLSGTLKLLRRTVFEAAAIGATDVALDTAVRAVVGNPLLQHVAGEAAIGAVAARRMLVLARATARACRILPPG